MPAHISVTHPNLGGRRIFVHAYNTRFRNAARLRESVMQRPNMKAIHLYNCCLQWEHTRRLRAQVIDGSNGDQELDERLSCDFMCAAALCLYSFSATIETFCNDIDDKAVNEGEAPVGLKDRVKLLLRKHNGGALPECYAEFAKLHDARNTLTHNTSKGTFAGDNDEEFGQHQGLGQAIESVLRIKTEPSKIAAELMATVAGPRATRWVRELLEQLAGRGETAPVGIDKIGPAPYTHSMAMG